jgi:hypothetical protein
MQKEMFQIVWKRRLSVGRYHDTWEWTITKGNNAPLFFIHMQGSVLTAPFCQSQKSYDIIIYLWSGMQLSVKTSVDYLLYIVIMRRCCHLSYPLLTSFSSTSLIHVYNLMSHYWNIPGRRENPLSPPVPWIQESLCCPPTCWGASAVLLAWEFKYGRNISS